MLTKTYFQVDFEDLMCTSKYETFKSLNECSIYQSKEFSSRRIIGIELEKNVDVSLVESVLYDLFPDAIITALDSVSLDDYGVPLTYFPILFSPCERTALKLIFS